MVRNIYYLQSRHLESHVLGGSREVSFRSRLTFIIYYYTVVVLFFFFVIMILPAAVVNVSVAFRVFGEVNM